MAFVRTAEFGINTPFESFGCALFESNKNTVTPFRDSDSVLL